jgi:hypothetical protein
VTRVLLVIAMVVSLWPVGVIAATAASDSSTSDEPTTQSTETASDSGTTTTDGANQDSSDESTSTETPPPDPDVAAYKALRRRTNKLLKALDASSSLHGVADTQLARRARQLGADYAAWDDANGQLDSDLHRLAVAERRITQRVATFSAAPTQQRLDRFNAAIEQFNRTLRDVQG